MEDDAPSYLCPKCDLPLTIVRTGKGVCWMCAGCNGRAVTLELLRRTFEPDAINTLWRHAVATNAGHGERKCPSCRRQMLVVPVADENSVRVDICRNCHFVWFDDHEIETLPTRPPSAKPQLQGYDPSALVGPNWTTVVGELLRLRY